MSNIRKAMNLGASDFITKPFDLPDFELAIDNAIKQYQSMLEAEETKSHVLDIQKELKIIDPLKPLDLSTKQQTLRTLRNTISNSKLWKLPKLSLLLL